MITHVVMFKLSEEHADQAETMRARLLELPERIPQIRYYEVGVNIVDSDRNYDLVLISKFDSREDLRAYSAHPDHQEVLKYIRSIISSSVAVDYETDA